MSIWKTLQIEPTDDIGTIKKAYAKRLKIYHPEEDPEGYQKLREAYDQAVKYAKQGQNQASESPAHHTAVSHMNTINGTHTAISTAVHPVEEFMEKAEALYGDFFARLEQKNWESLLRSDVIWNVEHADRLKDQFIEFLTYHYHFPRPIWELIDSVFRFSEQKEDLELEYGEYTVQFLLDKINGSHEMNYDIFTEEDKLNYDQYFALREEAQEALMFSDLETAKGALDEAYQLYKKDPDLLRMRGIYFSRMEKKEAALNAFNELLAISPDDPDGLLYRARIYYDRRELNEAKKDCEYLLSIQPDHKKAQFMLTKCMAALEDWEGATQSLKAAFQRDVSQPELFWYNALTNFKQGVIHKNPQYNVVLFTFLFLRRAWVYFAFFIIALFTPLPFKYAALLLIPAVWEFGKCLRLRKPVKKKPSFELYIRCLSFVCVNNQYLSYYFIKYPFASIRDRIIGKKFLKKVLKQWNIQDAAELKEQISWLIEVGTRQDFNHTLHRLTSFSEKTREKYVEARPEDKKLYIANYSLHTLTDSSVAAFDYAWAIYLARVGRGLNLLSKKEAQNYIIQAIQQVQQSYASWYEYLLAFHIGSHYHAEDTEFGFINKFNFVSSLTLIDHPSSPVHRDWDGSLAFPLPKAARG